MIGMDALGTLDTLIIDYRRKELQIRIGDSRSCPSRAAAAFFAQLRENEPGTWRGEPMVNKPMIVVAARGAGRGIGIAYYFHTAARSLPASAPAAVPPPAAPARTRHRASRAERSRPHSAPLPALERQRSGHAATRSPRLDRRQRHAILVPEDIVRHIVVTIDNLPRQKAPAAKRPTVAVPGAFLAEGDELHATLDPKNFARYDPMVSVVRQLDMQQVADVYLRFYPLFQSAYQNLGYPNGYFNDRLVQVIDSLLATPQPGGPIELTRPNVLYTFADPTLEALPAGQKLLLRMGPDNAAVDQGKAQASCAPSSRRRRPSTDH